MYKPLIRLYLRNRKSPLWSIQTRSVAKMQLSNELKFVEIGSTISEKIVRIEKTEICRLRHLYGYISGIGSVCHISFKLDLWPYCGFQSSPSLFKSIQPSPRKLCGQIECKGTTHAHTHTHKHFRSRRAESNGI